MKHHPTITDSIAVFIATLGPVGRLPKAPGTWGSAAALAAAPWCFIPLPMPARLAALCAVLGAGAWAAARAEKVLDRKDPGCIVVDELLGQWTAFLPFHLAGWTQTMPLELLALFALFRLFDILKPWPIRVVERRVPGGLGVMLDDLLAGVFAAASYALIRLFV
ncbi:MAG: phosphatidylglycerophosphatase A [Humidesulfovibrio sp.]|uniref:phosphatidylglycerophosphatase A family protein n=1 Tax=Humidesulfovibrio sp. TaxID=2910988 RepID=UPI0027346A56|nr:phosphatidylglycerophosphatase A [Humidesulfovibrio sp.]MDP2846990.1 phosphatidylglycerophosphatase A [Humidesulfovibrio sp.]